ncbi:hypothetical protein Mapa_002787 [Marchantia paleacea]|nr:hypothetical protein Mapa_002787 [Marchantia paleacea]
MCMTFAVGLDIPAAPAKRRYCLANPLARQVSAGAYNDVSQELPAFKPTPCPVCGVMLTCLLAHSKSQISTPVFSVALFR